MLESKEVKLLAEVGFLAAAQGDMARSRGIFEALQRIRSTSAFPYVGLAMVSLHAGNAREALEILDGALHRVSASEREEVLALRCLCLALCGRTQEAQQAAQNAGQGPLVKVMASLPWVHSTHYLES